MSKKTKNLDKYVVAAMIYIVAWSIAFFTAWIVKGEEPSVLEGCILSPGVVELVCAAWIKRGKGAGNESYNVSDSGVTGETWDTFGDCGIDTGSPEVDEK